jgi:hypothetical protein
MIVGSSQFWKKYYCVAFLKQMPNFNLLLRSLLTLTAFYSSFSIQFSFLIFVLSQLINTKKLYFSIQIVNTSDFRAKQNF